MSDRTRGCEVAAAQVLADVAHVQHADAGLVDLGHQHAVHVQRVELQHVRRSRQAAAAMLPRAAEHRAGTRASGTASRRCDDARGRSAAAAATAASSRTRARSARCLRPAGRPSATPRRRVGLRALRQRVVPDGVLRRRTRDPPGRRESSRASSRAPARHRSPGLICRCQSAASAVRVRIGSIDDELRAAALRFAHQRPVVQVGDDGVGAPQDDEAAVDDVFGIDARAGADRRRQPRARRRRRRCCDRGGCSPSIRTGAGRARPPESAPCTPAEL